MESNMAVDSLSRERKGEKGFGKRERESNGLKTALMKARIRNDSYYAFWPSIFFSIYLY